MFDSTRRDLIRTIAASVTLAGISQADGQHVHNEVAEEKKPAGVYKPKVFAAHEYETLRKLSDLIVPADEVSKGALEAGAPEFIDLLCSGNGRLETTFRGGLAWLDNASAKRFEGTFVAITPDQQKELLDVIAYRKNETPETAAGIEFFAWARALTVDAFYTSKIGIADVGYMGNKGMSKFEVPADAIQYALTRSRLG
jgi:hypothetical protein